jgi:hypothetical protein
MRRLIKNLSSCLLLGVALTWLCGCASTGTDDARNTGPSAMINLVARDEESVRAALIDSFTRENFKLSFSSVHSLLFERRGSSMSTLLHGGWPGLDEPAWLRAKIIIQPTGDNAYIVTCNASRVQDKGENLFEEEKLLTGSKATPFAKILQRARDSLK